MPVACVPFLRWKLFRYHTGHHPDAPPIFPIPLGSYPLPAWEGWAYQQYLLRLVSLLRGFVQRREGEGISQETWESVVQGNRCCTQPENLLCFVLERLHGPLGLVHSHVRSVCP